MSRLAMGRSAHNMKFKNTKIRIINMDRPLTLPDNIVKFSFDKELLQNSHGSHVNFVYLIIWYLCSSNSAYKKIRDNVMLDFFINVISPIAETIDLNEMDVSADVGLVDSEEDNEGSKIFTVSWYDKDDRNDALKSEMDFLENFPYEMSVHDDYCYTYIVI
jgi:hypothetical protein